MTVIIDRRKNQKGKSSKNRKRFLDRYKKQLQKKVGNIADKRKIGDMDKGGDITVQDTQEPTFSNGSGGKRYKVHPGNKDFTKGDKSPKPDPQEGSGSGSDGDGLDEYTFTLTKEEFLSIYFGGLSLPNFIKESMDETTQFKYVRAGYIKEGPHNKLDLKKTFEQSLARRIAGKGNGKKSRFLDDEDLRYRLFTKQPKPCKSAVMLCMMDVSGSVGDHQKHLSKQFFLLLFLFLTKEYETVTLKFVRYHSYPREVNEEEFFYGVDTGGTCVADALDFSIDMINREFNLNNTNLYVCHTSDGDYITSLSEETNILSGMETLLNMCQYYVYLQVIDENQYWGGSRSEVGLYHLFKYHLDSKKLSISEISQSEQVLDTFREIFKVT
tara:strand:- start:7286 stop:8434 length:1149 start_codon:yes stop_codon:yes gene_type:complete